MPPVVASVLFYAVIAWLLYMESKGPRVSAALWLATVDFALTASKPVTFWLYGNDYIYTDPSIVEGDPVNRTSLILLFGAGVSVLVRRRIKIGQILTLNPAVTVLLVYLAVSVLWSVDPLVALKRYFRDMGHIAMVLIVLTDATPTEAIERVLLRCFYILVPMSVLYIKYYPGLGRTYSQWTGEAMYTGVTTNKNTLGMLAMLAALFLIWKLLKSPKLLRIANTPDLVALTMSAWLLNISNSKTSVACFFIGFLTLMAVRTQWMRPRVALLKIAIFAGVVVVAILFMIPVSRGFVAEQLGRDSTLTTRTDIWERALALGTNPVVGAGYNSVWLTPEGRALVSELSLAHAHNGYLEVYLNTGVIGLFLLLFMLSAAFANSIRVLALGVSVGSLLLTWSVVGVVYNLSEVTFNKDNIVTLGLFLAALRMNRHLSVATVAASPPRPGAERSIRVARPRANTTIGGLRGPRYATNRKWVSQRPE